VFMYSIAESKEERLLNAIPEYSHVSIARLFPITVIFYPSQFNWQRLDLGEDMFVVYP